MSDHDYFAEFASKKQIVIRNKTDLAAKLELPALPAAAPVVDVCCLSGAGIEALKDAIKNLALSGEIKAEMLQVTINSRHQDALKRARGAARRTAAALAGEATLELVALDLREAANAIGEIVGKTTTEDLLDSIFSTFCIGK